MNPIPLSDFQGAGGVQPGHVQGSLSNEEVLKIMMEERGKYFDAALLDLFIEHLDEMVAIQKAVDPVGGR